MIETLKLVAENQRLSVKSIIIASDTINEIDVQATLNGDGWKDLDYVKAVFISPSGNAYEVLITEDNSIVPWEVLTEVGTVKVNLIGCTVTDDTIEERITTLSAYCLRIKEKITLDGLNTTDPTPSAYDQYVAMVKEYASQASASRDAAETSEENAKTSETNAKASEEASKTSEDNAKTSETNAKTSEENADDSESKAKESEELAKYYADLANQGAEKAGFLYFEIDDNEHVIMTKSDNEDQVDFIITDDGRLEVTYG